MPAHPAAVQARHAFRTAQMPTPPAVAQPAQQPQQQPALSEAAILQINAQIAQYQDVVEEHRTTINRYTAERTIQPNLRRGQLDLLINALSNSIAARQTVVNLHGRLGEADLGHPQRIQIETAMLTDAQIDYNGLAYHAQGQWEDDPAIQGRQRRARARWDRDPIVYDYQHPVPDDGKPFQEVVPRRRR